MHFLFLIKDKEVSIAELERGTTENAKVINENMAQMFRSYKQTKDPKRLVAVLTEEGMVSEVENRPGTRGKGKRVIRLSDIAKRTDQSEPE
jgi:hypothetical protein